MASKFTKAAKEGEEKFLEVYAADLGKTPQTLSDEESRAGGAAYNYYSSINTTSSGNNRISPDMSIGAILKKVLKSQSSTKPSSYSGEFTELEDAMDMVYDSSNKKFRSLKETLLEVANEGMSSVLLYFEQQKDLQQQINEQTSLTGEMSRDFRNSIMDSSVYANRLAIPFKDVADGMVKLIKDAGRFKLIGTETINSISLQSKVFFDTYDAAVGSLEAFQNVSRGASDAMKAIEKTGKGSLELGLNAKTTVETMVKNLEYLNQFGFKNGIEGLTRMIQKAQALRMDLSHSFKLAEEVMDPTKALSMAANLQVIGGSLGAFNDPIKMMWMATNNVQGLQDALAETAESLTTFNHESGAFEIVGADLRRAHAMSKELGMDLKDLTNLAVQSAQRTSAAVDLMSTGLDMEEEDREFLTNIAQMKDGKMVIEAKDSRGEKMEVVLESMTREQAKYLLSQKEQFEEMSTMDIARTQVSLIENMNRDLSFLAATARVQSGKFINEDFFQDMLGFDPNMAANLTKGFADTMQEGMIEMTSQFKGEDIKKYFVDFKKQLMGEETSTQTATTSTQTKQEVELTVKGGATFDVIMRAIRNDPELAARLARAFTNQIRTND